MSALSLLFTILLFGPLLAADESLIDRHIFAKLRQDGLLPSAPAPDPEFLRRVYLDLTGRLPEPADARRFLADPSPGKRQKLIDSLIPPLPVTGMRSINSHPFLDRWAYFFNDLFRNGELLEEGINTFYDHIYKSLLLNIPYDEFVRDLITASALSTWTAGNANFIARQHVFEGDGYRMNHEDTADENAIWTTKLFLGVNLECISCHDGKAHLEKINLWLTRHRRADVWRQAGFFGKTFIAPVYGRSPQFQVKDTAKGYDLTSVSSLRMKRTPGADVTPAFILDGSRAMSGEKDREAYARMLTSSKQFARHTVNVFWAELMGMGIVEPVFDFDLDRQDPAKPLPPGWTVQPTHPELLVELAADFREHGYDLRRLIRQIVSSRTYQLSAFTDHKPTGREDVYFSRRKVRRLSAEQLWDAVGQVTGVQPEFKIAFSEKKVKWLMQTHSPQDVDKTNREFYKVVQQFGQCDRYVAPPDRKASMIQAAVLLNDKTIRERVKVQKGSRLERLLTLPAPDGDPQIVDELYMAALSRPPSAQEISVGIELLQANRKEGVEDLLWALLNKTGFLFY